MRGIGVDERLWLRGVFSCTGPCGLNDVQGGVVWGPGSSEGEWGVGFGGSNSKKTAPNIKSIRLQNRFCELHTWRLLK